MAIVRYAGAGSATGLWQVRKLGADSSIAMETENRPIGVRKVEVDTPRRPSVRSTPTSSIRSKSWLVRSACSAAWTGIG